MLLYGGIGAVVLLWAANFLAAKVALRYLPPVTLGSFRVVLAGILMAAIYPLTRTGEPAREQARRFTAGDWGWLFVLGLFGVTGNQMLFAIGLGYTTVGHSGLIVGAGPITVLLLARIMKLELLTRNKLGGMIICAAGVLVLAFEKGFDLHSGTLQGDLIMWAGSFSFCLFAVLGKKVATRFDSRTVNLYAFLFGGLLAVPIAIPQGQRLHWAAVPWQGWAALLYMALLASVVAYQIYYWALRHLSPSRLAAFTYFQPLLATLLGVMVLGEPVTKNLLLGGALILVGVYLAERRPRVASGLS